MDAKDRKIAKLEHLLVEAAAAATPRKNAAADTPSKSTGDKSTSAKKEKKGSQR